MIEEDFEQFAHVAGKRLDIFLKQTAKRAAAEYGLASPKEDADDIFAELLSWAYASRPDLIDRATIRENHEKRIAEDPSYKTPEDFGVCYFAAKVLSLKANEIAQAMKTSDRRFESEEDVQALWTSKAVGAALKGWNLPETLKKALDSSRLPESWKQALERHYRDGVPASVVGKMTLTRARNRVVEILNSGNALGKDADPEEVAQGYGGHWGPQKRPEAFKRAGGNWGAPEASYSLSGPLKASSGALAPDSTDTEILRYVCAPSGMRGKPAAQQREWLRKYFDLDLELFTWALTGRVSDPFLAGFLDQMTRGMRYALWTRYSPEADSKDKRNLHEEAIVILKALRGALGIAEGKGMAKK
ncbi:hypothetical protein [Micromonospora sp. DT62]|uniref:hypothetical protein n=1 Tax=Micromonospora sp. DT62 TaxID=3416521 RepID=UPI003CED5CC6